MFKSAARVYGPALLAIVLSGMGRDGLLGARAVAEAGGTLIAQDRDSSAEWEMPASIAEAGLAHAVLPLARIRSGILGASAISAGAPCA
jgi:two-component system chemotaxis response regulator CheB